jgi:CBS domain-containing protein
MSKARDIMNPGTECIASHETLDLAARKMRDLGVGALPVCGADNRLAGIITDRDIVVSVIAEGRDPASVTAADLAQGTPVWVDAEADEDQVLQTMEQNRIRRVPVIQDHQLVGMISEADIATHLDEHKLAEFANAIYTAPPNS